MGLILHEPMSNCMREDVLVIYNHFSPASIEVISRMEHLNHLTDLYNLCQAMCEEGLLRSNENSHGITEYSITDKGKSLLERDKKTISHTKSTIFKQLRNKEHTYSRLKDDVFQTIRKHGDYLSIIEIKDQLEKECSFAEINSIVYGLIYESRVSVCGPLIGIIE